MLEAVYVIGAICLALAVLGLGYGLGLGQQQHTLWRLVRRQEKLMADFSVLSAEVTRAITLLGAPKPEDPAIQATIDAEAARLRAANDAANDAASGAPPA